ncbi:phosphoglycerate mutase family [Liquorilactobacillus sucicola DSM 21376 = JCM 15457]|uniref:Phosphoglycerate mutase n=1 Tax=Liquorilactobacillus sucicola DSM 21376 = JCM 15457 TaxID=1423806 RepID=A0A023CWY4_9LACO|nr:histidine phosphatase family protein [Liquorilactobacillus sucicola]KRN06114.1 phosphoglycerate mutase [Liquorilactobacillus sucicola DSM 21376 = JCM 15457]GAJ26040.1 phosphoglycerate mutase family [Liquorilactobacillus sucicola DSM 21376 = JCM 15457]
MVVHFYLVRHGQTELNRRRRLQGITDSPLTRKGIAMAEHLGKDLKNVEFSAAYVSDLKRTQETARYILEQNNNKKPATTITAGLRELNFGTYEEMKNRQLVPTILKKIGLRKIIAAFRAQQHVAAVTNLFKIMDTAAQSESAQQLNRRITRTLSEIAREYKDVQGEVNILVVAHAVVLSVFIEGLKGDVPLLLLKNARVSKVDFENGAFKIVSINQKKLNNDRSEQNDK